MPIWKPPSPPTPDQRERGSVWLISGIESPHLFLRGVLRGLRDGGVRAAIEIFDWQLPYASILNLFLPKRSRRRAAELAQRIEHEHAAHPEAPIDLVGYSAGGAVALWTAEALSPAVRLRNVVLIQPALHPSYDLAPALARISGRLVHFSSPRDRLVLGLGTLLLGTMDRRHCFAAGKIGFTQSADAPDPAQRRKLLQRAWQREMLERGSHRGGHLEMLRYRWNREFVAPYLR